ncbi:MAG: inositol monophosphatase family protein [Candidatus Thorarchaeota archaeon]
MDRLKLLRDAAKAAKTVVLEGIDNATELTGTENQFGDKTLLLDKLAEDAIVETIKSSSIPMKIMSEELGILEADSRPEYLAVIDPIDGSANLERGIPLCSIGIALIPFGDSLTMDDVEISIVDSIFTDETYLAVKGKGVTKNGKRVMVRSPRHARDAIISYDTKKQWDKTFAEATTRTLSAVKDMRRSASNLLDLCWVAGGSLDAMIDMRGRLPIVHVMGTHIVQEAGGYVVGPDGQRLNLPIDTKYRMSFVAASSKHLAHELLSHFTGGKS